MRWAGENIFHIPIDLPWFGTNIFISGKKLNSPYFTPPVDEDSIFWLARIRYAISEPSWDDDDSRPVDILVLVRPQRKRTWREAKPRQKLLPPHHLRTPHWRVLNTPVDLVWSSVGPANDWLIAIIVDWEANHAPTSGFLEEVLFPWVLIRDGSIVLAWSVHGHNAKYS